MEFLPGAPPLEPLRLLNIGGLLDTITRKIVAPANDPVIWYAGERQAEIIMRLYERDTTDGTRTLLYSAEGGGKTVLMAQGLIAYVVGLAVSGQPGAVGATAPTHERLQTFVKAICARVPMDTAKERFPGAWGTYYTEEREFRLASGHAIQCRSTKKQSEATGSPIQGFTWLASFDDELQDTASNGADADIESRLRGSKISFRLTTATAKDNPEWRTFRDTKQASDDWRILRLKYDENPFVWPEHWERMKANMSLREWQRRGLAMDVGPERQTYLTWERDKNLLYLPEIGVEDLTAEQLARWNSHGGPFNLLAGHDPGTIRDYTVLLKYLRIGRGKPSWWVVGEHCTSRTETEEHVLSLRRFVREVYNSNDVDRRGSRSGPQTLVSADPYSDSGNDTNRPDKSVYTIFRKHGFSIIPAAYATGGTGPSPIPKEAGIEMVCRLLCNAEGERRLFIVRKKDGSPVAPMLVETLEMSERDAEGKAETQKKDVNDLSHPGASLRYALWRHEKPRMSA